MYIHMYKCVYNAVCLYTYWQIYFPDGDCEIHTIWQSQTHKITSSPYSMEYSIYIYHSYLYLGVEILASWKTFHYTWWRHQMETFSALLAICAGNSPVSGEFPSQRPVTRSFDFFLICTWINGWVNNRKAGDLRCHRVHYDVSVM